MIVPPDCVQAVDSLRVRALAIVIVPPAIRQRLSLASVRSPPVMVMTAEPSTLSPPEAASAAAALTSSRPPPFNLTGPASVAAVLTDTTPLPLTDNTAPSEEDEPARDNVPADTTTDASAVKPTSEAVIVTFAPDTTT